MKKKLETRLLGTFEVNVDGKPVAITSRPAQSLFAFLILNAGTSHRREKLAGMLWPDSLEETARDNLRHALWRVRKALETGGSARFLHADDLGIKFEVSEEYWLDANELEKLTDSASADELISVLADYQGELLPGFYDEWVLLQREHLHSIFEHHMARLMSLLQAENRWQDILEWGERWIRLGQRPELAYRALMTAHAAKGDMSKVAATYERCVKSLRELGIEPSAQTREVYEKLKSEQEKPKGTSPGSRFEKPKAALKTNLPVPITSFVGREKEVQEIMRLLSQNRLVTLAGSGGVGKTRLAIESSQKVLNKFKDGVWWIDLVGLSDSALVPQAVARVLDVHEAPNQPLIETLVSEFQRKQALLVLDNCEHLILACAQLADRLLSGTRQVKILATSREALDILGETVWLVPSLSLPAMQDVAIIKALSKYESVRLFVERATIMQSQFKLTDENASAVVQVCRRLSGMPLAIELAAARVKMMTVDEIANRLDNRFSLLTSGNRTALPRQQTLRATIDWSHELLTEAERILFRRLAVFAGGFTLYAAESICGHNGLRQHDILDLLGRLVDKSLVVVDSVSDGGRTTRYRFLETIREYAFEKLKDAGEETQIRDKHLDYFTRLAEETEPHLYAPEQVEWFDRTDAEIDNLRAALDWSVAGQDEERIRNGFQLAGVLSWYWQRNYSNEFMEQLQRMFSREQAGAHTIERARGLNTMGFLHWTLGRAAEALPYLHEALAIARKHGDQLVLGWALSNLGIVSIILQDYDSGLSCLEESIVITKALGIPGRAATGMTLSFAGDVYVIRKDEARAQEIYEEAVTLLRETYNTNMLAYADRRLGHLMLKQGNYERARTLFRESVVYNREVGHQNGVTAAIAALAKLALAVGEITRAVQLYSIADARTTGMKMPMLIMDKVEFDGGLSSLRAQLDEKTFDRYWVKGRAMPPQQAIAVALEEI